MYLASPLTLAAGANSWAHRRIQPAKECALTVSGWCRWRVRSLLLSLFAVSYAIAWEYSTRRYLKGFSDAVIPAVASLEEKIQAILDWMSAVRHDLGQGPPVRRRIGIPSTP